MQNSRPQYKCTLSSKGETYPLCMYTDKAENQVFRVYTDNGVIHSPLPECIPYREVNLRGPYEITCHRSLLYDFDIETRRSFKK